MLDWIKEPKKEGMFGINVVAVHVIVLVVVIVVVVVVIVFFLICCGHCHDHVP